MIDREEIKTRDAIDFANEPVGELFRKMFIPTLLGMVSMVLLNLADGAFVGHGAGSDGLAAVNIAAPIFNIMTGIGVTFGLGASITASILLSRGNVKVARMHITQAMFACIAFALIVAVLIMTNLETTCRLFGSNAQLLPHACKYLKWIVLFMPFQMLGMVGGFVVRLDGSPKYAMFCTLTASILNVFLDWLLVFPLGMGVEGAAIATSVSFAISGLILLVYMLFLSKNLRFYTLRLTLKSFLLSNRNLWYQLKAGLPVMLGELAISAMIMVGNFVFMKYLGADGVAAYSVACYTTPIFFMVANAIVESSQPISSFAYGVGDKLRLRQIRGLMHGIAVITGILSLALLAVFPGAVSSIFIPSTEPAYQLCVQGLPMFGVAAFFISLNLVAVGYLQSIEKTRMATVFTLLRGFIFMIPSFLLLPMALGVPGIWLAIPLSEALCFGCIFATNSLSLKKI